MSHGCFAQPHGACMDDNHLLDSPPNKPARHTIQAILVGTPCGYFRFDRISWFGLRVTMSFSSANPQDRYVSKWMCNLVCVFTGDKKLNPTR
jgi:hypothetical protein